MSAEPLLSSLARVRRVGPGRWMAPCSAHKDKHPSLSIRELDDGRVLVHCFAGCAVYDVLAAVGLELRDLFPPTLDDPSTPRNPLRRPFNAFDILQCVAFEALLASVSAAQLAQGKTLSVEDRDRLLVAASRLQHAAEVAGNA